MPGMEYTISIADQQPVRAVENINKSVDKLEKNLDGAAKAGTSMERALSSGGSKAAAAIDSGIGKAATNSIGKLDQLKAKAEEVAAKLSTIQTSGAGGSGGGGLLGFGSPIGGAGGGASIGNTLALAGAATAAAAAISNAAKASFDLVESQGLAAEATVNLAAKLGITTKQASQLGAAAKIANVSISQVEEVGKRIANILGENSAESRKAERDFAKLGITIRESGTGAFRQMGPVVLEVLERLSSVSNVAQRVQLSQRLLGEEAAKSLQPLIVNYRELNKAVQELRIGENEGLTKDLAKAQNEIDKLSLAWGNFKKQLAGEVAPIVIPVVVRITEFLSGKESTNLTGGEAGILGLGGIVNPAFLERAVRGFFKDGGIGDNKFRPPTVEVPIEDTAAIKFRATRGATKEGLESQLQELKKRRDTLVSTLSSPLFTATRKTAEGDLSKVEVEIKRIERSIQSGKDYAKQLEEIKRLEIELGKLRDEAALKDAGEVGRIEQRRRAKIDEINRDIAPGAKRNQLVADFDREFGRELAAAAKQQAEREKSVRDQFEKVASRGNLDAKDIRRTFFGDGTALKQFEQQFRDAEKIRDLQFASEQEGLEASKRIQLAALEEVGARTLASKLSIEQKKLQIELDFLEKSKALQIRKAEGADEDVALIKARIEAVQKAAADAEGVARAQAAAQQVSIVRTEMERTFDRIKDGSARLFDSLVSDTKNFGQVLSSTLKTALLTPIREMVSSGIARFLAPIFGGLSGGGGFAGAGVRGAGPGLFAGSLTAAQILGVGGGPFTGGFAGGPGAGGIIGKGGAGLGGFGGVGAGALGFLKQLGSIGQGGGPQFSAGIGGAKGGGLLLGGGILAADGLRRGGLLGLGETTAGGALIGLKFGGPIGAVIGASVGFVAGLIRLNIKGATQKAIEKVKAVYGVTVTAEMAKSIVDIAKQSGGLDVAIYLPQIREMIELYAMASGQKIGAGNTIRAVSLIQSGGQISQLSQTINGQQYTFASSLPTFGGGATQTIPGPMAVTVQLAGPQVSDFLEGRAVQAINNQPTAATNAAIAPLEWRRTAYAG